MFDIEWMLARVERIPEAGCWIWVGADNGRGYGKVYVGGGKYVQAHRAFYEVFKGETPGKLFVCHSCDNRSCVNPNHLFLGTHDDNMRDCFLKGRKARGERLRNSKLTESDVHRVLNATGSFSQISALTGIPKATVRRIKKHIFWRHVSVGPAGSQPGDIDRAGTL